MQHQQVSACVEALCQTGCDMVRATIQAMEEGLPVSQTQGLSNEEQHQVLEELRAIMAVYDYRKCDQSTAQSPETKNSGLSKDSLRL